MHCFNLIVKYAVLPISGALYPECVHYRLNWAEKTYEQKTLLLQYVSLSFRTVGPDSPAQRRGARFRRGRYPRVLLTELNTNLPYSVLLLLYSGRAPCRGPIVVNCGPVTSPPAPWNPHQPFDRGYSKAVVVYRVGIRVCSPRRPSRSAVMDAFKGSVSSSTPGIALRWQTWIAD